MIDSIDVVETVRDLVRGLVRQTGLELEHSCQLEGGEVQVSFSGPDSALVLRDNARLLYAVNHILNQSFFVKLERKYTFTVDCEGYRGTRILELQLLARKAAEKVRDSRKSFQLQAMPASERRVIHLTLAEEGGVRTTSEGNGLYRRVVIVPDM